MHKRLIANALFRIFSRCAESLQTPATSSLSPGMEMVSDSKAARVVIDGPDAGDLEALVRQVAYLNTREFPAPGRRVVTLDGKVTVTSKQTLFAWVVALVGL